MSKSLETLHIGEESNISELTALKVSPEVQEHITALWKEYEELTEQLERVKDQPQTNETTEEQIRIINRLAKLLELMAQSQKNNKIVEEEKKEENIETELILKQISNAKEILGEENVFDHEAIKVAFGEKNIQIDIEQIPPIPFSKEELKRAKDLGQFLILRVDKTADGQPLTMENMNKLLEDEFKTTNRGKVLFETDDLGNIIEDIWYKNEDFFLEQTPQLSWALVTKEVIPNSFKKNYLEQTIEIINYLQDEVFVGQEMPKEYEQAIAKFETAKNEIAELITKDNWQKAAEILEGLAITKLTRQAPVEALYDIWVYFQNTEDRLLEKTDTWTGRRSFDGRLVSVGYAGAAGAYIDAYRPGAWDGNLGVSLSRTR